MSVVGIDLGTTNTVVGCVRAGKVHVLADETGARLLPSVVSFPPNGHVLVGGAAKARRVIDAKNTVYSHKRLMGRSWSSPEITQARQSCAFELREGPGQGPLVHTRGQDYTLPEISAFVLKRARQIAERALGTPVHRSVITVPAHFNELQRASTKVAGRVAGLEVLRILNEPTAAALAYGLGRTGNERVAVYDFGGGTFDCTLLDLSGNVFEVLATSGDSFLGGDDVDLLIANRMADVFLERHRQDARQDPQLFERLKAAAEDVKIAISRAETHSIVLKDFGNAASGSSQDFQFTLTRKDFDAMLAPVVDRTFKVTEDALALARLAPSSFDKVILVGGSTRMPLVRKRVETFFGSTPMDRVNPDEVVAIGAAIQAAALTEGVRRRSIPTPPRVSERPPAGDETTQPGDLGPTTLKTALGSKPPSFDFRSSPDSTPASTAPAARTATGARTPALADPLRRTHPGIAPATPPTGAGPISLPSERLVPTARASSPTAEGVPPLRPEAPTRPNTMPDEPFGALADLSLVSASGVSPTSEPTHDDGFGHISDLSLIASPTPSTRAPDIDVGAPPSETLTSPPRTMPLAARADHHQEMVPTTRPLGQPRPAHASAPPVTYPSAPPVTYPSAPPVGAFLQQAPVLVDVTPRALVVETVGGFTDTIIPRNSKIPCERTRRFATGRDMQTTVKVRVAQGENPNFLQNTYLGEVDLSGLRAAPRGVVTVAVTFEVDADGTLRVRARDVQTGQEARATLQLVGIADEPSVVMMISRVSQQHVDGGPTQ